jgi:hypothetical protein
MAIDTPAKLAILGAGPIGLEVALYARFLGYDVIVLEQGRVCEHVLRRGHVSMFFPFTDLHSPLGLAALQAQHDDYQPPARDALLSGREWVNEYLGPLAATDLLAEHIRPNTRVLGVGKEQVIKTDLETDLPEGDERGDWSFRILVRDADGAERIELADGVLDCTGVYSQPNFAGHGGLPAMSELSLREQIHYHLPDVLGADRAKFANQRTLLIGDGIDAARAAVLLDQLRTSEPATEFVWITRHEIEPAGPVTIMREDLWPGFGPLKQRANEIATSSRCWHWGTHLERVERLPSGRFAVELSGSYAGTHEFDQLLALVEYRGDASLFAELQVSVHPIHGGNDQPGIRQSEANFYILGSKSAGRHAQYFTFADGLAQIRAVFALLGDRPSLDLYASEPKLR